MSLLPNSETAKSKARDTKATLPQLALARDLEGYGYTTA
jgi:hypothetical protein